MKTAIHRIQRDIIKKAIRDAFKNSEIARIWLSCARERNRTYDIKDWIRLVNTDAEIDVFIEQLAIRVAHCTLEE